jgi:hypothetical protein
MSTTHTIKYTNSSSRKVSIILEPWAEEYGIEPLVSVEIVGRGGPPTEGIDIESHDDAIVIYAWRECTILEVFKDGVLLEPFT